MDQNRELILSMLMEITSGKAFSHILMKDVLDKYDYKDTRDKAFIKRVTEGTLERMIELDYIIDNYSKLAVKKMKPFIACLLRMSVYQLLYMEHVPDSAACNEAVKIAKKKGFGNLQGFVNGVLRTIARNKEKLYYPEKSQDPVTYLSIRYSMPPWIVKKWIEQLGEEKTEIILKHFLETSPVTLRLKEDIGDEIKTEWYNQMMEAGGGIKSHPYLPYAYCIEKSDGIQKLPGYKEGLFAVQDISSMLVVEAAGIAPGDFVLDVCAAPGGKALHAAGKTGKTGMVLARDITENKISMIKDNAKRLDYGNIEMVEYNACIPDENMIEKADILIADLPCSGFGILGKKKEIKYRITQEQIDSLVNLQKEILSVIWQYVKPGGILMYSTCTINREENNDVVEWFLKQYPFSLVSMGEKLPEELGNEENGSGFLRLFPGIHQSDGFFMAKLHKLNS